MLELRCSEFELFCSESSDKPLCNCPGGSIPPEVVGCVDVLRNDSLTGRKIEGQTGHGIGGRGSQSCTPYGQKNRTG